VQVRHGPGYFLFASIDHAEMVPDVGSTLLLFAVAIASLFFVTLRGKAAPGPRVS